ncbi:esterase/lipase family protein [Inhella sp.]|uniref:esterase/lipase family protein n=1 Tax=Inhella sp. TaxID=1921806 RepID=UPI0035ADE550
MDALQTWLAQAPTADGVRPLDRLPPPTGNRPRASYRRQAAPGSATSELAAQDIVALVRENGVLRWRAGAAPLPRFGPRAGGPRAAQGARAALPMAEVLQQFAFERLPGSQVYTALGALDTKLTPQAAWPGQGHGLRRWRNGALEPFIDPAAVKGKALLIFIHGTFSNSESLLDQGLMKKKPGQDFLADAQRKYDLLLAYDHPTLSVSPMLNAFDLAALLRAGPKSVDIVCHSRGGLVARWYCEAFADPALRRRVVFVASPLGGTSLAAAPSLKNALDLLTNVADALRIGGDSFMANALFTAVSGLLRVLSSVTGAVLSGPLLDAAIALVPGLDAMSRVGNNPELLRLQAKAQGQDFRQGLLRYAAIRSNFEPQAIGWNFLRLFSQPMLRAGDWAADLVFDGPNDLVVNTDAMALTADRQPIELAHDFGRSRTVHHCNYFEQPQTVEALRSVFEVGSRV